ncbi:hypothetical protein BDW59DRAFT_164812 [Aspergillus cavernicola]|uniref:Uncharacterized protein n=1 Tax=Aspergillus cavernicola TaxID=176166 RepID=A0ABR4HWZ0_9EURO
MHLPLLPLLASTLLSLSLSNPVTAQFEKPHGIDSGNTACAGACLPDPGLLPCERIQFRPQYGCFMCCISDDDLDNLDEGWDNDDDEHEE